MWPLITLGFLELSLGRHEATLNVLAPLLDSTVGMGAQGIFPTSFMPDAVEAMVALGRLEEAARLVEVMEAHGAESDRPWIMAVGSRCRSMLHAAAGELGEAEATLQRAMVHHERLPMPFEKARTQLFLGQVLRRQRKKNAAATTLREALTTFRDLGMPLWANRVGIELGRADAPRVHDSDLTPSELRVARSAAAGMSNKDIASALFISPKTVEHNLSSVYRKLGVRTRAELATRSSDLGQD